MGCFRVMRSREHISRSAVPGPVKMTKVGGETAEHSKGCAPPQGDWPRRKRFRNRRGTAIATAKHSGSCPTRNTGLNEAGTLDSGRVLPSRGERNASFPTKSSVAGLLIQSDHGLLNMLFRPAQLGRIAFAWILVPAWPALCATTKSFELLEVLRAAQVAPVTRSIATREGFVLAGIQTGTADSITHVGDQVTALVSLGSFDGKRRPTQWIIRVQLDRIPSAASISAKTSDITQYTNTGEKFVFHSAQSGMKLETLGPIKPDTKIAQPLSIKRQNISVATDFLSLGLDRTAVLIQRLHESKSPINLSYRSEPFSSEEINLQRPRAADLNFTSDDLRSFSGSGPALLQFLEIVRRTPDLQDILFQVLDKPSLIDVFTHGASRSLNFEFIGGGRSSGSELFWPDTKTEELKILFLTLGVFGKPALRVALYLTAPRPPLLVSAGILGLVAFSPSKPNKVVIVRVLSASAGAPSLAAENGKAGL